MACDTYEDLNIDNCIMHVCSTDNICTPATRMLYNSTCTIKMKLFLVPSFYSPWFYTRICSDYIFQDQTYIWQFSAVSQQETYECDKLQKRMGTSWKVDKTLTHSHRLMPHFSLFARFCHLRGQPRSQAQICAHCDAFAVRRSLNCEPVSFNALHVSGSGELKQWIHSPDRGSTCK